MSGAGAGISTEGLLAEEQIRDQLSAAEELLYLGYREPALVAVGAALESALRRWGCATAGSDASIGALLDALVAARTVSGNDHELLARTIEARDRLIRGYAVDGDITSRLSIAGVAGIVVRLLEKPGER
jgi:hypothetical protein